VKPKPPEGTWRKCVKCGRADLLRSDYRARQKGWRRRKVVRYEAWYCPVCSGKAEPWSPNRQWRKR